MKHRVLVVEDDPAGREMLCDWLELEGYQVDSACSLSDAVLAVELGKPEIVLLDVHLGNENGLTLTAWMREQPDLQAIPVIAVTAHAMLADHHRILEAGCNASVSKPVEFASLTEQLRKWLAVSSRSVPLSRTKQAST